MTLEIFDRADQLVTYVNDNAVTVGNIARIEYVAGKWYLFHY